MMEKYEKKLEDFLRNKTNKNKIIVIYGPTASGKTSLSINLAKKLNTEIISTDSRQIFKEMNIGTAKITKEEMQGVYHHMIDIIYPNENYSVGEFKNKAEKIIQNLFLKGKIPILAGGTGLYIDSLIYDFNIPKIPPNLKLRKDLEKEANKFGKEYLYKKLQKLDPDYAKKVHPNNLNYIIRALEVKIVSGRSKVDFIGEKKLIYDTLFLTPYDGDRNKLYERINKRVDLMIKDGLIEEVKNLLKKYNKNDFGLKTIGYKEIIKYFDGELSLEEAIELIKKNSRNYAKRQLTWFKKYK